MTDRSHYQWLHVALAERATVLTSSRRLALELRQEFDEQQIATGLRAWPSAEVHFWQDWLQHLVVEETNATERRILDSPASVLLWERCLSRALQVELLSTSSLVRQARRAWQRLQEWQVPFDAVREAARSRDEYWFADAALHYQQLLDDGGWLDASQLASYCATSSVVEKTTWPAHIVLAGFDRLTPALSALFAAVASQGCAVDSAPEPNFATATRTRSFADAKMMWRAAGHWARQHLQQDPQARIAIVAPDLEADATGISGAIREGFAPGWQLGGDRYRGAVNVSYGMPLNAYPAITVAVLCLRFASEGLNSTETSQLLRTGFLGDADTAERARLDLFLRSLPDRLWQPGKLLAVLRSRMDDESEGLFLKRLEKLAEAHASCEELRAPAQWAEAIDTLLSVIGWPGREQPDSAEFQLQNRWRQLLNELARLGGVSATMTLRESVHRIAQIAGDTIYQPESQQGGLRLLGMLEAIGLEFDYLWLGGMDASRWPASGNPLALVSRHLQRDLEMPDASPADTLLFAQRTLQRLSRASRNMEVSWARLEDDKELIPSPLINVDQQEVLRDADDPGWYAATLLDTPTIPIPFDDAPAVEHDEQIAGGAYTVQSMREEPFKAFAEGRLHVADLEVFQPGFSARMRGTIVHDALHHLLRELPAQPDILAWDGDERALRVDKAAWQPLAKHWQHADPVLQRLLQLEKRRLEQLLSACLDKESARENFQIEGLECRASLKFGPVQLRLRIDRLDRLADGSLLIIDYKASDPKSFMDRKSGAPKQLQLCVYARALEDDSVGGLQYIFVNSREIKYVGEGGSIAGSKIDPENWSAILEDWCAEVDVLLKRLADGEVGINVLQEASKARPLAVLSRIAELSDAD